MQDMFINYSYIYNSLTPDKEDVLLLNLVTQQCDMSCLDQS